LLYDTPGRDSFFIPLPEHFMTACHHMAGRNGNRNMSKKRIRSSQSKAAIDAALEIAQEHARLIESILQRQEDEQQHSEQPATAVTL
jgi:hypothetical protein